MIGNFLVSRNRLEKVKPCFSRFGFHFYSNRGIEDAFETSKFVLFYEGNMPDKTIFARRFDLDANIDIKYLLGQAYEKDGTDIFQHLLGDLTLLVVNNDEVIYWGDDFGFRRLYYSKRGANICVFNDVNLFYSLIGVSREIEYQGVIDFFLLGTVYPPHTCLKNIFTLSPDKYLNLTKNDQLRISGKGTLQRNIRQYNENEKQVSEDISELVVRSVNSKLAAIPDPHIGAALSGGIDSAAILGIARMSKEVTAFTIASAGTETEELRFSKVTAEYNRVEQIIVYPEKSWLNYILRLLPAYGACPNSDLSQLAYYHLGLELRRRGLNYILCGQNADTIFFSVPHHPLFYYYGLADKVGIRRIISLLSWVNISRARNNRLQKTLNFINRSLVKNALNVQSCCSIELLELLIRKDKLTYLSTSVLKNEAVNYLSENSLNNLLFFQEIFGEAQRCVASKSIPLRVNNCGTVFPFYDRALIDYCYSIPNRIRRKGNFDKIFFREAMARYVHPVIANRKPHGLVFPILDYIGKGVALEFLEHRYEQSSLLSEIFRKENLRDFLEQAEWMEGHKLFLSILILELWYEVHFGQAAAADDINKALNFQLM